MKVVISEPATRKSYQVEIDAAKSATVIGKKIGEDIDGDVFGLQGYTMKITGGSDTSGFPMRPEILGTARRPFLIATGPGFHPKLKGQRKRKLVCGNAVSQSIAQLNVKVVKAGEKKLEEVIKVEKKEKPAEKKEEPKK